MSFVTRALPHRDGYRLAPNCLLRSSLFGAISPWRARPGCTDDKMLRIATTKEAAALQSYGDRLDQSDLDVLIAVFAEFALRESAADEPVRSVEAPLAGLLAATGRQDGGKNRLWLHQAIERLNKARISLENEKAGIWITCQALIRATPVSKTRYEINLPNEIRQLFDSGFAGIHWQQRRQLSHLGKWLHAYYSTHKRLPHRMGARLLGQLSGWAGEAGAMNAAFPKVLEKELKLLAEVSGWKCEIAPETEQVFIQKPDDGVGGNAATAAQYHDPDFGKPDDVEEDI